MDLRLLQAIVIYLECLGQHHGDRTIWTMTGLLTKTAVSSGLHRDGSHFLDMSPFEAEMRRRVWWYVCLVDLRFSDAQAIDMTISEHSFDTRQPSNINDDDLWVGMSQPPQPRESFTDLSLTILRCELWRLMRRVRQHVSMSLYPKEWPKQKKGTVRDELAILHRSIGVIQHRVLRHLDMEQPLHRLVETLARVNLARAELLLNYRTHFGTGMTPASLVLGSDLKYGSPCVAALSSLEWTQQAREEEGGGRWAWAFDSCVQWVSLSILLVGLLRSTAEGECAALQQRAWRAVTAEVDRIPEALKVCPAVQNASSIELTSEPLLKSEPIRQPMWTMMRPWRSGGS